MYRYNAFGLNIKSELILPELLESDNPCCDVEIKFTGLINFEEFIDTTEEWYFEYNGDLYFIVEGVAKFRVSSGCLIEIEPEKNIEEDNLRLFVLGSALGALIHQRGLFPLHASAIEVDGKAYLFSADSGFGKSTLCQGFQNKGYKLITDDICVLDIKEGKVIVYPGYPQIKLWKDSMQFFEYDMQSSKRVRSGEDKYRINVKSNFSNKPLAIGAIFFLSVDNKSEVEIIDIRSFDKMINLKDNIYRSFFMRVDSVSVFYNLAKLSNGVPFYKLIRPKGYFTERLIEEIQKKINNE